MPRLPPIHADFRSLCQPNGATVGDLNISGPSGGQTPWSLAPKNKPAPDILILAAIERAVCHGASDAWIAVVGEHLGFERTAHNTRRLRRQLEHLRAKYRWVASRERYGREHWSLTLTGQLYLAAARKARQVGELPESPQHREWRRAHEEAGRRMEGFRALLYGALKDAGPVASAFTPPNSAAWFALGERLGAAFWLLGSAIYYLEEWPEPDDARLDSDENPGPAPGRRVKAAAPTGRLRPGELDSLVLAYMRKHKKDWPLTASAIGKGIERSSGAVANCLARLTKKKEAHQAKRKPRAYDLKVAK